MADRKREDAATVGDLQDLAESMRGGFSEALKDVLGKVVPSPTPKGEEGSGGESGGSEGGEDKGGGTTDWGFGGRWWGNK